MQESRIAQETTIACPRCGYDQRGAVSTWTNECPLTGLCSECGLHYEWRELLNPRLTLPRWFVEAERPRRFFVRQSLDTFRRSFVPWRFWSAVRMSHPQDAKRIVAYGLVILVALYACLAFSHGLIMWGSWRYASTSGSMTPSTGGWPVFLQGALLPLSNNPVGQFSYPGGTIPYQSPASGLSYWFGAAPALLAALSSQLVCGIAFALLPVSRRRAKVNWSHIIRVTSYGFALVIPAIMATMLSAGLTLGMNRGGGEWLVAIAAACWLALPIMLVIWWSTATSRYLRMPHAWGVGVSVVILGLLTPFTVVMVMMMYVIP